MIETTVGDFCPFAYGRNLPSGDREHGPVPVYGSNGIIGWHDRALTDGPTVVVGRKGTIGQVCYSPVPCWPIDTTFYVEACAERDVRFAYFLLSSLPLETMNSDSAVPGLNREAAHSRTILVPPIAEQHAIGHILGTLDDRIELNNRTNETLESMAQALFKSWFMDFDPVYAKADRRDTGLPPAIDALFPDSFQDSELGRIPKSWTTGLVEDFANVTSGKRPGIRYPKSSLLASVPLWGGNGPMAFVHEALIDYSCLLTGRVGTLGSVFRITKPCWPSDNTLVLRTKIQRTLEYLFLRLKQVDFMALNSGSTQPLLTQTDLKAQPLLVPSTAVLEHFHVFAGGLYEQMDASEDESRTLADLRDTLLPKLLSGELRVKDAEHFVQESIS